MSKERPGIEVPRLEVRDEEVRKVVAHIRAVAKNFATGPLGATRDYTVKAECLFAMAGAIEQNFHREPGERAFVGHGQQPTIDLLRDWADDVELVKAMSPRWEAEQLRALADAVEVHWQLEY